MSCNYYAYTKDMDFAFDMMPRVSMLEKTREFEIHLCQTCSNLKPLFEYRSKIHTFSELSDILNKNASVIQIKDEYGDELSVKMFLEKMTQWNTNTLSRKNEHIRFNRERDFHIDPEGYEFHDGSFS